MTWLSLGLWLVPAMIFRTLEEKAYYDHYGVLKDSLNGSNDVGTDHYTYEVYHQYGLPYVYSRIPSQRMIFHTLYTEMVNLQYELSNVCLR